MLNEKELEEVHKRLSKKVEAYIKIIREMYNDYMSPYKKKQLDEITDYSQVLKIHDYGTINGYATYNDINMPLCADKALDKMKKVPFYGIHKKHKTYKNEDLIINNNTFFDYVFHVVISGTDTEGYYEDLLLHETMHFCGSDGASALKEGLNELLTRKVAYAYGLRTSACGYPKEVKLAYELEKILGEEVMTQIAFINNEEAVLKYLEDVRGKSAAKLYKRVSDAAEREFDEKYYKHMDKFNGVTGVLKKIAYYKRINYKEAYKIIEDYKNEKKKVKY